MSKNRKYYPDQWQRFYAKHKERVRANRKAAYQRTGRLSHVARTYGISPDEYMNQLVAQQHRCAICKQPFSDTQLPHVDHDHATRRFRGVLCINCNTGLGQFKDDSGLLQNAAEYLSKGVL